MSTSQRQFRGHNATSGGDAQAPEAKRARRGRGGPRLYHKKSRTGCQRCRARKVKCNEVHPICGGCQKHRLPCVYNNDESREPNEVLSPHEVRHDDIRSISSSVQTPDAPDGREAPVLYASNAQSSDVAESRKRRLLELRLLHQYTTKTCRTLLDSSQPAMLNIWATDLPNLAFQNDAMLYTICFVSALHLTKTEPLNTEASEVHQIYLDLALRSHSSDLEHLTDSNADAVCQTSRLISLAAFATLQDRPLHPYTAPKEWMRITRSAGRVFKTTCELVLKDEESVSMRLLRRIPLMMDREALFRQSNCDALPKLASRVLADDNTEPWDAEIQEAYQHTISYLGALQVTFAAGETPSNVCRLLMAFPPWIPQRFIELLEELRPRALVVLAHFFAFLARFRDVWWIGDTGRREIHAIKMILPEEWQDMMVWPLKRMEETFVLR